MNLFRLVHFESWSRGNLAAIRYAARAVRRSRFLFFIESFVGLVGLCVFYVVSIK
jgi:hypothetical protein